MTSRGSGTGIGRCQCNLGLCYQTGRGVQKDAREAVKWFIKSRDQSQQDAQHNLGLHYAAEKNAN